MHVRNFFFTEIKKFKASFFPVRADSDFFISSLFCSLRTRSLENLVNLSKNGIPGYMCDPLSRKQFVVMVTN